MFGEPAVDFEGETVQRFTAAGDVMVAVYEHRIVEFRHDGERWQAEPSVKFGGEQKLRGMVRTDYDDESNMFSEYKYLTDKGVVDSTIAEYHAVLAEQNVRNAGTIMSFDDKFFVFDSGRLYVMRDRTFDEVAVPLVDGARDIVLATGSPRYSGYIRKSSGSVYFQNGRAVTNIPFKAEGGVFNSLDEHFVGTDSGFVKLEYAETAHPRINRKTKNVVAGGALKYVCGYEASQHAMLVTESETGYLDYLKFDASGSYTNDVKERKATAWFA